MQKNQTVSWEGYHKYPETTEIPGGWFLGQKTQLLFGNPLIGSKKYNLPGCRGYANGYWAQ